MKKTFQRQWLLLVTALLFLGAVIGFNLHGNRHRLVRQENQRILTQTRVIARNMEAQFKAANQTLEGILQDLPSLRRTENAAYAQAHLASMVNAMPGVRTLFLTDAAGTVLAANRPEIVGVNFRHRDYFSEPQHHPDPQKLYISPPFKSLLNIYVFNITRMIADAEGRFAGIVTLSVDPEYFEVLLESVLYAPDMIATINHGSGVRFMILPHRADQAGKDLAVPGSMFSRHQQSGTTENIYTDIGYATGEQRTMALITLDIQPRLMDKPPCIIVGRLTSEIMRPWRQNALLQGLFFLLTCVVAALSLLLAQRRQAILLQAEKDLAASRQRFVDIFDFIPDATAVFDQDKRVIAWNKAMEKMTGVPPEEMLGQGNNAHALPFYGERRPTLVNLLDADDPGLKAQYSEITRQGATLSGEAFCPALHQGAGAHLWAIVAPLYDAQGLRIGAIESIRDISAIKELEKELQQKNALLASQARLDFLTGIYNRLMFNELLRAELASACRYQTPVAMIMFDLDHFKRINDTLGHNTGDHVLKEVAGLVARRLRAHDYFCRWGGEEFLILATKNELTQAVQLAEVLRRLIADHDFGDGLRLTASFGVGSYVWDETPEALIDRVDTALYRAKTGGRNRVET
jgi:diguanylate cyclase (GGDEF)-like protein/PAS domain S-box-containing protein